MGSGLVSDLPSHSGGKNKIASHSYTEQFYEHLPFYLSIGMTFEQYWDGDCCLVKYYRKAHYLRQQRLNQELWAMGAYVYEALTDVAPVLHAFAKKGTKPTPYISEPFALTNREVKERKEREEKRRYEEQMAKVAAWRERTNALIEKKGGTQDG